MICNKYILVCSFLLFGLDISAQIEKELQVIAYYDNIIYPFFNLDSYNNNGSYKAGGEFMYSLTNKLSLGSGIYYEENKYFIDHPNEYSPAIRLLREEYSYSYIGFPFLVSYSIFQTDCHRLSLISSIELQKLSTKEIIYLYNHVAPNDMTNQFSVDKVLHSVTLGVFYKSIFWKSAFIGFCPKVQYNLSRNRTIEAMDLSFLLQLSVGYIFGL